MISSEPRLRVSEDSTSVGWSANAEPNCIGFLSQRAEESTDEFVLAVQVHEPLFERAREAHPVVELEFVGARKFCDAFCRHAQYDALSACPGSAILCNRVK